MSDYLKDMMARRRKRIAEEYGVLTHAERRRLAATERPARDFEAALLSREDVAVIAEVKKRSPAAGPIAPQLDAGKQALRYQAGGAAAVSVLTEPEDFGGAFSDLRDVSAAVELPILCKDFVVDPIQLFVARANGAHAVLLMVSVLGSELVEYLNLALTLEMTPIVEVIDEPELDGALAAGANTVLVNSRDLRTLIIDKNRAHRVTKIAAGSGAKVISASGIESREDVVAAAKAGAHGVLVGEALMRLPCPIDLLKQLTGVLRLEGRVKCPTKRGSC